MDKKLRNVLTDCIRDIETGAADVNACIARHPDHASELRAHLDLWSELDATPKASRNLGQEQRGQQTLLTALSDADKRRSPFLKPAMAKATAAVAGVVLLTGGAAGASAALGGPDVTDQLLSSVGITGSHEDAAENGLENAREHANENADFGLDTAEKATKDGLDVAEEHASDKAQKGLDRAREARDNAGSNAPEPAGPPESAPAPDSVPAGDPPDAPPGQTDTSDSEQPNPAPNQEQTTSDGEPQDEPGGGPPDDTPASDRGQGRP